MNVGYINHSKNEHEMFIVVMVKTWFIDHGRDGMNGTTSRGQ